MIPYEDRTKVKEKMIGADLRVAVEIYKENTGRNISHQMLYCFIAGRKPCDGMRPSSHQPVEMYRAICQAIHKRQTQFANQGNIAAEIRAATIEAPLMSAAAY